MPAADLPDPDNSVAVEVPTWFLLVTIDTTTTMSSGPTTIRPITPDQPDKRELPDQEAERPRSSLFKARAAYSRGEIACSGAVGGASCLSRTSWISRS